MVARSASAALFFHAGQVEIEQLRHAEHSEQRSEGREHPGSSGSASQPASAVHRSHRQQRASLQLAEGLGPSSHERECGQHAARFSLAWPIEVFRNPAIALMLSRTSNLEPARLFPKDSQTTAEMHGKGRWRCVRYGFRVGESHALHLGTQHWSRANRARAWPQRADRIPGACSALIVAMRDEQWSANLIHLVKRCFRDVISRRHPDVDALEWCKPGHHSPSGLSF
jgi:hypothetical protein